MGYFLVLVQRPTAQKEHADDEPPRGAKNAARYSVEMTEIRFTAQGCSSFHALLTAFAYQKDRIFEPGALAFGNVINARELARAVGVLAGANRIV